MQVRPIEFQESFARVPVEQARQQHVLMREPDLASDQVGRTMAQELLLDQSRPVPMTPVEDEIIDPERATSVSRYRGRTHKEKSESEQGRKNTGRHLDVIA